MLNKSNTNATSTEDLTGIEDEMAKNKKNQQQSGVVVMAPDGELLKIGKSIKEDAENRDKNKKDDVIYRLYDEIPPYLYYTNKLDENLLLNYESMEVSGALLDFFSIFRVKGRKILLR
jgi:hypothetical protein